MIMIIDDFDVRDLYVDVGHYILPRLAQFRDQTSGFPLDVHSREEWIDILDKMIYSFIAVTHDNDIEDPNRVNEGFVLFGRYFRELYI